MLSVIADETAHAAERDQHGRRLVVCIAWLDGLGVDTAALQAGRRPLARMPGLD